MESVRGDRALVLDPLLERAIRERTDESMVTAELTFKRKNGTTFPGEITSSTFVDADGTLSTTVSVRDITERKQMEERLAENEKAARRRAEELETLMNTLPVGIWVANDNRCESITGNREALEMTGIDVDEEVSRRSLSCKQWTAPIRFFRDGVELKPEELPLQMAAMRGVESHGIELETLLLDGRRAFTLGDTRPLFDEDGNVRGAISAFVDITERKRYEADLLNAKTEWEQTFDHIPDLIAILDNKHNIVRANKAMLQRLGSPSPDRYVGLKCYRCVHGTDSPPAFCPHALTLADGQEHRAEIHEEGLGGYFLVSTTPIFDNQGELKGTVHVARDITDLRRTEANLKRSNAELQQFAYIASHDLQEPLRMVTSYLALMNKKFGDELSPQAKEYMSFAVDGSTRMKELIDDLLAYSRIDSKSIVLEEINMNDEAKTVEEDLHVMIKETRAEVIIDPLPNIRGDKTQMKQLLTNLISNAIKFRRPGFKPRVEVSAVTYENEVVFSVEDNGIGIDPEYADKLFKMFSRLHTREEYPGTGIGLAVAKKIVERHGGRIWFESEPGKGTTFFFTIPA
ncbi:MAG: ATP-binding protein [Methanomassiliicoccus sp.]|nr:ATP-binding protein [Methanomassiliicoccus sp.]